MRRKVVIITALCVLAAAGAAYAASANIYGATFSFSKGAGTKSKPVGIGFSQMLTATNSDSSKAANVLLDIKTKVYGLVANARYFPTCSASRMVALKSDSFCPKGSKAASGLVNALLGDPTLAIGTRVKCDPNLDVFNAGGNKLTFLFTTHSATQCAGLKTGDSAPYTGYISQRGKYEVLDVPLPADVSTRVANQPRFYGSLIKEQLTWPRVSTKVKGKTVYDNVSVGCLHGRRPWSVTFTSTSNGSDRQVKTISGSSPC
ncbi:MAG: hypothetical protein JOZ73_09655 [Solirubrobacterales bacterium]|nr:hypothetical protein [Solirubrobacterales bacterium]